MKTLLRIAAVAALGLALACTRAASPTPADIEKALKADWEKPATAMNGVTTLAINSVKIGSSADANEQDVVDGIPPKAQVTAALVDFTVRERGPKTTHAVRRVRECKVYQDQFGDWRVMISRARGTDQSSDEPNAP